MVSPDRCNACCIRFCHLTLAAMDIDNFLLNWFIPNLNYNRSGKVTKCAPFSSSVAVSLMTVFYFYFTRRRVTAFSDEKAYFLRSTSAADILGFICPISVTLRL